MNHVQSQLASYQPKASTTPGEIKAMGARAWIDHETLVVRLSAVTDPIIRGMIRAIAAYLGFAGKRNERRSEIT